MVEVAKSFKRKKDEKLFQRKIEEKGKQYEHKILRRKKNYFKKDNNFRPQNTSATVGTGILNLDIHFDFINSTIAANSELLNLNKQIWALKSGTNRVG